MQAHDICNRLACLGLFPPFIFFFCFVFPLFCGLDGVSPHLAPTCGNNCGPFHCHSIYAQAALGNASCLSGRSHSHSRSRCRLPAAVSAVVAFLFFYCLLLFYYYRNSALLSVPLFAPLFMPPCGRHYFSSASCKLNKTHTYTHTHKRTRTYPRNLLMN